MKILKKLFKKRKKDGKKQPESWYNNFHEQEKGSWAEPIEGAYCNPNHMDYTITNQVAKRQH